MDLIYTDENMTDQDTLIDYILDMAYGSDENDFSLEIPLKSHCMKEKYYIYIDGTEYGGIIDKIKVDTDNNKITYSGRTWHGIMESHVIEPEKGYDYYTVSGEANKVLSDIIIKLGLQDIFCVPDEDSGIILKPYNFYFKAGYTGILALLEENNAKPVIRHEKERVILMAAERGDYSEDEEWDSSQVGLIIEKDYNPANHLICLGSGDLKNRYMIHLFTNEYGGVQPYTTVTLPVSDKDYILDKSKQLLFGASEVTQIFECNSQDTENYVKCETKPSDWDKNYNSYFQMEINDSGEPEYKQIEGEKTYQYVLQSVQPADWATGYMNYYQQDGSDYKSVQDEKTTSYVALPNKPQDWETNYKNYFYYYYDGVNTPTYESVKGKSWTDYQKQKNKPSDWEKNFSSYYQKQAKKNSKGEKVKDKNGNVVYEYVSVPSASKKTKKAPNWSKRAYYTAINMESAPGFIPNFYYMSIEVTGAPAWNANTYYNKVEAINVPAFSVNIYKKEIDHFAKMVEEGIEKLKEYWNSDKIETALNFESEYDVGDIVGGNENTTGISSWKPISKKIVKIERNKTTISYETGGE